MSLRGCVAAGHEQTAQAAARMLREGGNAFDAILAAMCAACVAEPVLASLGGGGFLLARTAAGVCQLYDFFVHTPRQRPPQGAVAVHPVVVDFGTARQVFHYGPGTTATPGFVKGLFEIHRQLGSMPVEEIVAPAVELCREGVVVNRFQADVFRLCWKIFEASEASRRVFSLRDDGGPPRDGVKLHLPDLANTFEWLAREGESVFYEGEIARRITEHSASVGGCLRADDLAGYRVELRRPLELDYRGVRIETNPPPSCGGTLFAFALRLLEQIDLSATSGFGSLEHLRCLALALELTDEARFTPEASHRPVGGAAIERLLDADLVAHYRSVLQQRLRVSRGTTHMNAIDAAGNVASLTLSNGEGSGEIIAGTGVMLNNMLGEEDLVPEGVHCWPTDRRLASMMSPTLLEYADGTTVATGSGGSKRIRSSILQVALNLVDFGMSPADAVSSPRIFFEGGKLSIEGGFAKSSVDGLVRAYPHNEVWQRRDLFFGGAHTVEGGPRGFRGTGDQRRGGVCRQV